MIDQGTVVVEHDEGVASVRLNRPDKRNAIDDATFEALIEATEALTDDRRVRAVVLRGEGTAFCAGMDLSSFQTFADESEAGERPFGDPDDPGSGRRVPGRGRRIVQAIRATPVPVIAAIQGPAIGAGLQLALAADIRIAGPEVRFAAREIQYGITLDMGGTQLLPRLIGADRALAMITTGRMVGADEAVRIGLATSTSDDPVAAAHELARSIAGRNPDAIAHTKRLVRMAETSTVDEGMAAELQVMAANIGGRNQTEAVRAHFEGRPAVFEDRA